jgi:hypothetical protein
MRPSGVPGVFTFVEDGMKQIVAMAAFAFVAGCTADNADRSMDMQADREARLAADLRGYEQAGPPVSCVNERDLGGNHSAGDAIVFNGRTSSMLYVNRPIAGCPELGSDRALIVRTSTSRLCRGDIATVFDPVSRAQYGGCGLGDFTPYRRSPRR